MFEDEGENIDNKPEQSKEGGEEEMESMNEEGSRFLEEYGLTEVFQNASVSEEAKRGCVKSLRASASEKVMDEGLNPHNEDDKDKLTGFLTDKVEELLSSKKDEERGL